MLSMATYFCGHTGTTKTFVIAINDITLFVSPMTTNYSIYIHHLLDRFEYACANTVSLNRLHCQMHLQLHNDIIVD